MHGMNLLMAYLSKLKNLKTCCINTIKLKPLNIFMCTHKINIS